MTGGAVAVAVPCRAQQGQPHRDDQRAGQHGEPGVDAGGHEGGAGADQHAERENTGRVRRGDRRADSGRRAQRAVPATREVEGHDRLAVARSHGVSGSERQGRQQRGQRDERAPVIFRRQPLERPGHAADHPSDPDRAACCRAIEGRTAWAHLQDGAAHVERALEQVLRVARELLAGAPCWDVGPFQGHTVAAGRDLTPAHLVGRGRVDVLDLGRGVHRCRGLQHAVEAQDGQPGLTRRRACRGVADRQREAFTGDGQPQGLLGPRTLCRGPRRELSRAEPAVPVGVDRGSALCRRYLGQVEDVLDRDRIGRHHEPAVSVDREVAERVGARGSARGNEQRSDTDDDGEGTYRDAPHDVRPNALSRYLACRSRSGATPPSRRIACRRWVRASLSRPTAASIAPRWKSNRASWVPSRVASRA